MQFEACKRDLYVGLCNIYFGTNNQKEKKNIIYIFKSVLESLDISEFSKLPLMLFLISLKEMMEVF